MGNASVKEDLGNNNNNNNQSGVGFEQEQFDDEHGAQHMVESESSAHVSYLAHGGGSSEHMSQSPPPLYNPTAALYPLMFSPQVPSAPLQRPGEMDIPSHAWMQNSEDYDYGYEEGIPTMITWSYGGREVAIEGSWDNWKTRKPLQRSGKDFTTVTVLPSGVYHYRFLVDGHWRYIPDLPWAHDDKGNAYNILDLQDYVPEDLESIAGFEPPPSPDSSYNNSMLSSEDFAKEPPLVPPHLQMTLLNEPSSASSSSHSPLPRPPHVVLNHLYVRKGKSGQSVVALGSTHRFQSKYVTVVLYKSLQR